MKLEVRGKPSFTPFSKPLPEPSNTVSMKMPQNTPNAVSDVRSLCRLSVLKISCHFSMSMNTAALLRPHRFDRRDPGSAQRRHEPGDDAHTDQQRDGGHRHLEVHLGIHEIRHLRPGSPQREGHELQQSDPTHEADI